ncbi:MAG: hypothetical protein ACLGHL_10250 [Actinomycetota bacterium]
MELPNRRQSLQGETYEGERLRLSFSIAKKLYVCPACREPIGVGASHTFVAYLDADPPWDHEHWHTDCAHNKLIRSLATSWPVPAPKAPRPPRRGRRR